MASPLTLLMPVKPGTGLMEIGAALKAQQPAIDAALDSIGTVHYARFLLLDRAAPNLQPGPASQQLVLAVITEYDGSFKGYIGDFVSQLHAVFDALLAFVDGADAVVPVKDNVEKFLNFAVANDASQHYPNNGLAPTDPPAPGGLYEAYPGVTVQKIKASVG